MRYRARVQRHHRGESARRSFSKRGAGMVETGVSTGGSTSCLRLRNWWRCTIGPGISMPRGSARVTFDVTAYPAAARRSHRGL